MNNGSQVGNHPFHKISNFSKSTQTNCKIIQSTLKDVSFLWHVFSDILGHHFGEPVSQVTVAIKVLLHTTLEEAKLPPDGETRKAMENNGNLAAILGILVLQLAFLFGNTF